MKVGKRIVIAKIFGFAVLRSLLLGYLYLHKSHDIGFWRLLIGGIQAAESKYILYVVISFFSDFLLYHYICSKYIRQLKEVSAANDRKRYPYTTTKTKVTVEEVLKGEAKTGQSVFIYEPAGFSCCVSKSYQSIGGYQLMKEGEEYYVFLKKLKTAEGYKMSDKEKNTYLPTNASYSKFPVQGGVVKAADKQRLNGDEYRYGEIQNMEIITSNRAVLSRYKEIKEEVIKRFADV